MSTGSYSVAETFPMIEHILDLTVLLHGLLTPFQTTNESSIEFFNSNGVTQEGPGEDIDFQMDPRPGNSVQVLLPNLDGSTGGAFGTVDPWILH